MRFDPTLYVITDRVIGRDRPLEEIVSEAIRGGATMIQLREKALPAGRLAEAGRRILAITRRASVPLVVNDRVDLAIAIGAEGVHVGPDDLPVSDARRLMGAEKIVGASAGTVAEARQAEADGADYIGVGSIFPTGSKADAGDAIGSGALAPIRAAVRIPIVAVGGVTHANADEAIRAGADGVAVISAVVGADDVAEAARRLAQAVRAARAAHGGIVSGESPAQRPAAKHLGRKREHTTGTVLAMTIAGSDSGGGAGIQADLKTFTVLGVFGTSAITALTAQNTTGVSGVVEMAPEFVVEQIDAIMRDIGTDAAKTGMLANAEIIEAVATAVRRWGIDRLVVDPVMIAKSGAPLLRPEATDALRRALLPAALVVTPNLHEAAALVGRSVSTLDGMHEAARRIHAMGPRYVVVKGGHLEDREQAIDVLYDGAAFQQFSGPRAATRHTHGTGCVFSAAIAAGLAKGQAVPEAVARAKRVVTGAIAAGLPLGAGHGPADPTAVLREATPPGGDRSPERGQG